MQHIHQQRNQEPQSKLNKEVVNPDKTASSSTKHQQIDQVIHMYFEY